MKQHCRCKERNRIVFEKLWHSRSVQYSRELLQRFFGMELQGVFNAHEQSVTRTITTAFWLQNNHGSIPLTRKPSTELPRSRRRSIGRIER
jgi:hypothetical protein